jgi:hypothetical protein
MDDADFQTALTAAFQTPAVGVAHRDMTETILERVRKTGWARAGVLAGSGLVGVAIAVSALVATELARPVGGWALAWLAQLRLETHPTDASPFVAVGLVLMALTLLRNTIRDL